MFPETTDPRPILNHPTLGLIRGETLHSSLIQFRNIPYASVPHRFARSSILTRLPSPGHYDAIEPGPISIQSLDSATSDADGNQLPHDRSRTHDESQSEACLNLTITAPLSAISSQRHSRTENLPVVVFIHGGAFFLGAGTRYYYDPIAFVRTATTLDPPAPLIFVAINYRLGALGFLHSPASMSTDHPVPANNGLHDQLRALEWVQRHIAGFGGDPDNVTVLGQSAGGESVSLHVASGQGRGLFKRAVAFSGTSVTMPAKTPEEHERNFREQAEKLGVRVRGKSAEEVARAMQEVDVEKIRELGWVGAPCTSSEAMPDERASMWVNRSGRSDRRPKPDEWLESQIISTTTYDGSISYIMTRNNPERKRHAAAIKSIAVDVLGEDAAGELLDIYDIKPEGAESEDVALRKICLFESDIGFFAAALSVAIGAAKEADAGDATKASSSSSRTETTTFLQIFSFGNPFPGPLEQGKFASHTWDIVALLGAFDDEVKTIEEESHLSNPGYKPYTTILAWRERLIRYMTAGEALGPEFGEMSHPKASEKGETGGKEKEGTYGAALMVGNEGMSEQGPEVYLDGEDGGRRRRLLELAERCKGEDGWDVFWEGVCRRFLMAGE